MLEPATPWRLDYAEDKCRLARAFGEAEDRHIIFFEQSGRSAGFGLTIAGPSFGKFRASRAITIQFGSELEPSEGDPYRGTLGTAGPALIYANMRIPARNDEESEAETEADSGSVTLAHIDGEQAATVENISFSQRGREIIVQTGNLEAPLEALNGCAQQFLTYWGLDLEQHLGASRLPVWTNRTAIVRRISDGYPFRARRVGEQGVFRMRVIVDENGGVAECHLSSATISETLESDACHEMGRAEFEPARDGQGTPMRSFYTTTVAYAIGSRKN